MKRKNLRVTLATVPKHIPYSMHTVLLCKSQTVCNQFIQREMLEGAMGGGMGRRQPQKFNSWLWT